ncbi:unnamed protein product [Diatraea saccharalis]|uniref:Uncharacterized protein n=1 Tax=Diatraea saccharalis TaxID=40085 RepID=A0A9N9R814_9NEOP|nr:unnamed protein product [Diatraea saccharalis]
MTLNPNGGYERVNSGFAILSQGSIGRNGNVMSAGALNPRVITVTRRQVHMMMIKLHAVERHQLGSDAISDCAHGSPLVNTIESQKAELNERDQELSLNDIEVTCVPEQREESLQQDTVSATRVGRLPETSIGGAARRPRPIVVRLVRPAKCDELLRAAHVRHGVTTAGVDLPGVLMNALFVQIVRCLDSA